MWTALQSDVMDGLACLVQYVHSGTRWSQQMWHSQSTHTTLSWMVHNIMIHETSTWQVNINAMLQNLDCLDCSTLWWIWPSQAQLAKDQFSLFWSVKWHVMLFLGVNATALLFIPAHASVGDVEACKVIIKEMEAKTPNVPRDSYNTLLKAYARCRNADGAVAVLRKMQRRGKLESLVENF